MLRFALGVLDHLRGFGDFDRRRAMDARRDDGAIDVGDGRSSDVPRGLVAADTLC